ncbi:hypothetical protein AJ80_01203 [Polytolypa hystricis UAMH7299]|uniref:Uncharacterized protein n=1 Tax=Polytolypa hystricis (strain UAMH7299) TaxID=1447883 RepID=A0A2B7Z1L5_POLH7|nr:hypothetical protein AJ80_01203 [Polytolypa hystricis UAMH7299]
MAQVFTPDTDFAGLETPREPNRLQSITALARFEFEAGKGNEGTKILMVEWEDDDLSRSPVGSWHVSWAGKRTVLPADERTDERQRRCYFLLPPGTTIPPVITLSYEPPPSSAATVKKSDSLQINPLPAIFPPELGATARSAGKKGVLHTIWGKKRLQVLEKEIKQESKYNAEGVALEMALQEREWIEANFGVSGRGAPTIQTATSVNTVPLSPTTPISPTGGRKLSDKLKGLKLGTSEKDLAPKPSGSQTTDPNLHPLSPDGPDLAISSFSSFHNTPISAPSQKQQPNNAPPPRHAVAHAPPEHVQAQQQQQHFDGFSSLATTNPFSHPQTTNNNSNNNSEDDLFAIALSPRSPDIPRSPFSFSPEETKPYAMNTRDG